MTALVAAGMKQTWWEGGLPAASSSRQQTGAVRQCAGGSEVVVGCRSRRRKTRSEVLKGRRLEAAPRVLG